MTFLLGLLRTGSWTWLEAQVVTSKFDTRVQIRFKQDMAAKSPALEGQGKASRGPCWRRQYYGQKQDIAVTISLPEKLVASGGFAQQNAKSSPLAGRTKPQPWGLWLSVPHENIGGSWP